MNTQFDMQITAKDLYKFNMRQVYTSLSGAIGVVMPIVCIVMAFVEFSKGIYSYFALYLGFGVLLLLYMPVSLWFRAKSVMKKGSAISGVLHYDVDENAIKVSVKGEKAELPWNMIYKVIETKSMILVYSSRVNAYILMKDQMGETCAPFKEIATKNLEKYRLKLKK